MTEELEASSRELDRRRRFTEAILESIPTGVISLGGRRLDPAREPGARQDLPGGHGGPRHAPGGPVLARGHGRDQVPDEARAPHRRWRRGSWSCAPTAARLHLAVTVSALEEKLTSGFVIVLEDTSELLRAQKAAAWHEVARRVAHEIKNPLTPIALSAERIGRQLDRLDLPPGTRPHPARVRRHHRQIGGIGQDAGGRVLAVRALPDRAAGALRSERSGGGGAGGVSRTGWTASRSAPASRPDLPPVNVDREQFKRVVVNLVDNAAEAMQDSLVKTLYIATQPGAADTVELVVADTGCGVSAEDKEKLFLPYFSTKNRGTGLGLAIVSHILAEHNAHDPGGGQPAGGRALHRRDSRPCVESEPADAGSRGSGPQAAPR